MTSDKYLLCFQVLNKYCALIEDVDRRIEVASKHGCHETAIEVRAAAVLNRHFLRDIIKTKRASFLFLLTFLLK